VEPGIFASGAGQVDARRGGGFPDSGIDMMKQEFRFMGEEPAADDERERQRLLAQIRNDLLGRSYSSLEDLRDRIDSRDVRMTIEEVRSDEKGLHLIIRTPDGGEIHLHAERSQLWHPYYVRAVEAPPPE
jgi:hypothetical protein